MFREPGCEQKRTEKSSEDIEARHRGALKLEAVIREQQRQKDIDEEHIQSFYATQFIFNYSIHDFLQ